MTGRGISACAHEVNYVNATGENWVCMYTSINIVSMCITFWGPPRGHGNGCGALSPKRQKPSQAHGFETYIHNFTRSTRIIIQRWEVLRVYVWFKNHDRQRDFKHTYTRKRLRRYDFWLKRRVYVWVLRFHFHDKTQGFETYIHA